MEEPDWFKTAVNSEILSYDNANANPGEFTKKLISLMKEVMRKNSQSKNPHLVRKEIVEALKNEEEDIARNNIDGRY